MANTDLALDAERTHQLDGFSLSFSGGNIGINNDSPTSSLDIAADIAHVGLKVKGSRADSAGDTVQFMSSAGTINTVFEDGGNVGIGTSAPSAKLHVLHTGSGAQFRAEGTSHFFSVDDGIAYASSYYVTSAFGNGYTFAGDGNVKFKRNGAQNAAIFAGSSSLSAFLADRHNSVGLGYDVYSSWNGTTPMPATVMLKGKSSDSSTWIMQAVDSGGTLAFGVRADGAVTVAGSASFGVVSAATDYSTSNEVFIGINDTSVSGRTVTIKTLDITKGRVFVIKDESGAAQTNSIRIITEGSQTMDGVSQLLIQSDYGVARLYVGTDGNLYTW
jgi:hypothetical protein